MLAARFPAFGDVAAQLRSLATPYRGPIDEIVTWVRARYPDPERLVIATNYEELALMYYLESHVIVGLTLNNLVEDRRLEPDLVIPRRHWRSSLPEVVAFLRRGRWERNALPVVDLHYNNNPALSRSRFLPDPHRFRTAVPAQRERGARDLPARGELERDRDLERPVDARQHAGGDDGARRRRVEQRLARRARDAHVARSAVRADLEAHERRALVILPARERRVLEGGLDAAPDLGEPRLDARPARREIDGGSARFVQRRRTLGGCGSGEPDDEQRASAPARAHFHDTVTPPS